jgi:hypothetical protein
LATAREAFSAKLTDWQEHHGGQQRRKQKRERSSLSHSTMATPYSKPATIIDAVEPSRKMLFDCALVKCNMQYATSNIG